MRGRLERRGAAIGRSCTPLTFRLRVALLGLLAFAAPLAVYVFSLHHGVDYWDTGELQTVPYILGIPHPSGFPAYVIFGWVWVHTLAFADPATLMNLFSAIGMSIAAFALFAFLTELGIEPFFALGSAVVFGCTRVPWDHATRADVHAVALAAATLAFWSALRWSRTGSVRALIACAITAACALAIHSGMILVVPGIALVALGRRPSLRTAVATLALGALIVAAFYAYLPLRSAVVTAQHLDPTLTLGVTAGRPFWDNDHPSTFDGFRKEVGGGEFGATHALRTLFDPHVVSGLYERYGRSAIGDLAGGVVVIALFGVFAVMRRSMWTACGLLIGGFLPVLFVLAYTAESDPARYFLPSYWVIGVMLGAGAQWLSRGGMQHTARGVVLLVGTLFLFVAASNVYANRGAFFGGGSEAQSFIDRVRTNTPDNAVLVAAWMYATPLAYGAYVQHSLGNRIVLTGWPEDYTKAEYRRWLAKRPVIVLTDEDLLQLPGFDLRERDALLGPTIFTMTSKP
jgi:Protein of unknown function (DUF2723)